MFPKSPLTRPKVLLIDIETAPALAYVWALFDQNISIDQIVKAGYVLCVSWKWLGEKDVHYIKVLGNEKAALKNVHQVLDAADIVVHYNGIKFDIPTLNREFLLHNMPPPSPIKQVDLLKIVRRQFKFSSNKLDFVCRQLGLGNKVHHKGMGLWDGCMAGKAADWKVMREYNKEDVRLLERLYYRLLPWIVNHPNVTLHTGKVDGCPRCGHTKAQKKQDFHAATIAYTLYQCNNCHGYFRGAKSPGHTTLKHRPV